MRISDTRVCADQDRGAPGTSRTVSHQDLLLFLVSCGAHLEVLQC